MKNAAPRSSVSARKPQSWMLVAAAALAMACAAPRAPGPASEPAEHVYVDRDGRGMRAFVFATEGAKPAPAVLLFHGGGWAAGEPAWTFGTAQRLAEKGAVAIAVEYRLAQGDVTPIDALADACAAFRWARAHAHELQIDPDRIAGHGVSAGGQLVAATATVGCPDDGSGVSGAADVLALWSPALDLAGDGWFAQLLQGRAAAADLSPVEHVGPDVPPAAIVIGAADTLTPLAGSESFCDQVRAAGQRCELFVYEGVGHLLTRNLAEQERNFDPDPDKRADGVARLDAFLAELGYLTVE